jgi:5-keto 4-deoxyuronate isomerase
MAKDPAFLFYTSDFLTGTLTMTDEQVGRYIRLLCLQHQKYELTEKDMLFICKGHDEDIFSKFEKTEDGKFYNVRLREEAIKRSNYSESRRHNKIKKDIKNIYSTYGK